MDAEITLLTYNFVDAKVARGTLRILATSAPSERVFSVAELVITKLSSSLKPEDASSLILLKENTEIPREWRSNNSS